MNTTIKSFYIDHKKVILFCVVLISSKFCFGQSEIDSINIPKDYKQVVLVVVDNWNSSVGTLAFYNRDLENWSKFDSDIPVSIGKNGLGWGIGLHKNSFSGFEKVEGDGKSPAGVFKFGTSFGYNRSAPANVQWEYKCSTNRDYFIDDVNSDDYNRWVSILSNEDNSPKTRWRSFERMKRSDHLYELGLVVNHNNLLAVQGKGSAIFLHVWRTNFSPTLGCTAMSKENMIKLLQWLDPQKNPILIQVSVHQLSDIVF